LGTIDEATAFFTVHPGAVYLHASESFIVNKLDVREHVAYVMPTEVNYYTTPGDITTIGVVEKELSKIIGNAEVHFGKVFVTTTVSRYFRKRLFTDEVIESIPLSLPEQTLNTQALWIEVPPALSDKLMGRDFDLGGTIHAAEHVSIGMMPLFALCDRNDIGGVSHPAHLDVNTHAAIFIYDGYPGGVGLAKAAYDSIEELLETSLTTMQNCKCDDGCPACVQSPKCGNNNNPLDKAGAVFMLKEILEAKNKEISTFIK
jgi:DEAD/DEAH box helicase domain-containing protein